MLWTVVAILVVLWLVGLLTSTTFGGLIHLLLVIALIVFIVNMMTNRRAS